ncbi:MAG TPA: hypothetical protein VED85_02950, partial [Burkholderiaceae bacterium]|nr:hypothetical protein [Burkholderiaceae bacterium]
NVIDLGSGVNAGEKVVLNISSQIGDGDLVAIDETPSAPAAAGTTSAATAPASAPAVRGEGKGGH